MEARVLSVWEEMRKGVSNQIIRPSNSTHASHLDGVSEIRSNKWVSYLGLGFHEGTKRKASDAVERGDSTVSKRVAEIWDKMNEGLPARRLKLLSDNAATSSVQNTASQKLSDNWKMYLALDPEKAESLAPYVQKETSIVDDAANDEAKRIAAAAIAAVKNATAAAASNRGKIEITEVRDFAGQEIEIKRLVDADSKEASERVKAPAPSAVDAVLEQIKKKQKLSVLDKTKKDWGEFKEENKGLEEELDAYKKSSNQYLDKVSFLERADYRQFERERDVRLAQQAKRRPDMRDDL